MLNWSLPDCKRELVETNAYQLQSSMSERVVVDGHGCHTALHFGVKAEETQGRVPTLYWLPKLHKNPIKQDLLLILVLVRQQKLLKHVIKYCEKVYEKSVKFYFGLLKIQVIF